ncbi:MAG: enoyl-CoA hydratase, partial [Armatimonadetes bacterium]|nr:enoyl-CoA hydratase [Armatimonadota bacterium]NIM24112.1 enoyl-CoA hydratase [Armatimonadota bacterium]NIM67967.1 enoyl-CoA hydratase [Armatimonadota bacterium]NIN06196.1 enoyl-CoA hydratase [Armatimonadota bacterium]NIO97635.1 enoyl-CoA hydratase [Armatimonadota bacterium]
MPISVEKKARTIYLTLERPPLNVLSFSLLGELRGYLEPLRKDREMDFLVLRGAGERAFSAGV